MIFIQVDCIMHYFSEVLQALHSLINQSIFEKVENLKEFILFYSIQMCLLALM